jgi:site-specific recombinase XerD
MTELILSQPPELLPASLFAPTPKAARRVIEFFATQINNDHTRKAYLNAARRFSAWCDGRGLRQLADVQPIHVAAFIKELQGEFSPPTVKQHLAALRMLFDWLVTGHVMETNRFCQQSRHLISLNGSAALMLKRLPGRGVR